MAARRSDLTAVAVTRPGLEGVCASELTALGLEISRVEPGAVTVAGSLRQTYLACRWVRTATRVLLVAGRFRARTFSALQRGLDEVDWGLIDDGSGAAPQVRASANQSRLFHTGAIAERVLRSLARDPDAAESDDLRRVDVRIDGDVVTVRFDLCGESLDRRGWRLETAKAPLPPTVAAAAVLASGWDRSTLLIDPCCGAGTIAVEAALISAGRAPTVDRVFAVERWPSFEPGTWASAGAQPSGARTHAVRVLAADRDAGATAATTANAERAGVEITVETGALSATLSALADHEGWVVTNPPWGSRVGDVGSLRDLYASLGNSLRDRSLRLALVTGQPQLAQATSLSLEQRWRCQVGGQDVALYAPAAP